MDKSLEITTWRKVNARPLRDTEVAFCDFVHSVLSSDCSQKTNSLFCYAAVCGLCAVQ